MRGTSPGLMAAGVVVGFLAGMCRGEEDLCSGHGLRARHPLEQGVPVQVTVTVDDTELRPRADLGFRHIGETVRFSVAAEDADKDVCAPDDPAMAYVDAESDVSVEIWVDALRIGTVVLHATHRVPSATPVWTNEWEIPVSAVPEGGGTPVDLLGQRLRFQYRGLVDDWVCNASRHEPSANDPAVDLNPYYAIVTLVPPAVDVDVDSDNNHGVLGEPNRDQVEERVEEKRPGKYIPCNDGDEDNDQVPEWADGLVKNSGAGGGTTWVPLVVEVADEAPVDWERAKLRVTYEESDARAVREVGEAPKTWYASSGEIRIWNAMPGETRDGRPVLEGGNWVQSGEYPARMLMPQGRKVRWYVEGVGLGDGESAVTVELDATGAGTWGAKDTVRVTMIGVDVDVDSDNTAEGGMPERDGYEDRIENAVNKAEYPGKLVVVNDGDVDGDGVPDYADWHITNGIPFVPVVVEFREPLDLNKVVMRLRYEDSDPRAVRIVEEEGKKRYERPEGVLRLWRKNADVERNPKGLLEDGDYVKTGDYGPDVLPRLPWVSKRALCLKLEGVQMGKRQRIEVAVDPDGTNGPAGWVHTDAVRVTTIHMALVPDYNHDRTVDRHDARVTVTEGPFHFWINDDRDRGDIGNAASDIPGQGGRWRAANWKDFKINGRRDTVDFFPVWLDVKTAFDVLPPGEKGIEYRLCHAEEAVHAVYTDLRRAEAGVYLTQEGEKYGKRMKQGVHKAQVFRMPDAGEKLAKDFLKRVQEDGGKGVLLVEGCKRTEAPLRVEVWKQDVKVLEQRLALRVDSVERMYRWINLRHVAGGQEGRPTNRQEPTHYPDRMCNRKQMVFLHGYNVTEEQARGWAAEIFKRLYWSGSRAMFTAVTWYGDDSRAWWWLNNTPNYYVNVIHAFETASNLVAEVRALPGDVRIAAHSLGNMVVSSAIVDYGLQVEKYILLNAAVAMEAYKGKTLHRDQMRHPDWKDYAPWLWASEWHDLFAPGDGRRELTWRNRFGELPNAYNYFSSGEDVLNNGDGRLHWFLAEERAWVNQEMRKGLWPFLVPGNNEGGWGFNPDYHVRVYDPERNQWVYEPMPPEQANQLSKEAIRTNSFFRLFDDRRLYRDEGSRLAREVGMRRQLLADAIPALSFALGRNDLEDFGAGRYDLNTAKRGIHKEGNWPRRDDRWRHSDIQRVAYPYAYRAFDQWVNDGGLR